MNFNFRFGAFQNFIHFFYFPSGKYTRGFPRPHRKILTPLFCWLPSFSFSFVKLPRVLPATARGHNDAIYGQLVIQPSIDLSRDWPCTHYCYRGFLLRTWNRETMPLNSFIYLFIPRWIMMNIFSTKSVSLDLGALSMFFLSERSS